MVLTAAVGDVLRQLDAAKDRVTLHVDGHDIPVTNLDKPLWPGAGARKAVTKRSLLRYLARVSRWMLPHLSDRPLFVTRFPNGIGGKSFYQKHWDGPPPFARTVAIYSSQGDTDGDYLVCENLATLLWLGQMGSLELHAWYSRTEPAPDGLAHGRRFTGSEAALEKSVLNYPDFVNSRGKSLAVPYSPRRHLEAVGDPWHGILEAKQALGAILGVGGAA